MYYSVYIMTNDHHGVLYTGVTNNLIRRVYEHREGLVEGFTSQFNVKKLVYYEVFEDIRSAIAREKQVKAGSRRRKVDLINGFNKDWKDLFNNL